MVETNIRGETPREAFKTAVVQAFAPALRDKLQRGEVWSEERLRERLERELVGRGFTLV